ncbi:hypothetical protein DFQ26_005447 [Actinomortierella ambigua]|nr:hypothetical protein DFQ26_005447 [Actinomortierella ambigua]
MTSLCLYSVQIQKDSLATLMTLLHGPSLDRLCIADACTSLSPPASTDALNAVTLVTLADLVRWSQYFPFLRSIEVQIAHNPDFIGLLVRLQQLFPRADLLGIDYRGPSRPLATGFIHVDGLLTRLEVQKKNWHSSFPAAHLSVFLCSDQARHLDTLHAPGIEFPVKMLSARTSSTYDAPDGAWRCKNLRHLSIQLIGRMSMDYSVDLRFVLAYFVANCPNLVHLELEREDIHFHPEGGLCLTSRLPHLQRLIFRVLYYVGHTVSKGGSYEDTWAQEAKARWILPHPTQRDIELAQSSLRLCRSVAGLSLDPNLIQNDIFLSGEGCCWIQMDLLHIELAQSKYNGIDMARQDVKVFRRLRPDIAFSVTES